MKKVIPLLVVFSLILLLIPSALAWNHSRGGWDLFLVENITEEQEEELVSLMVQQRLAMMKNQGRLTELREAYRAMHKDWDVDIHEVEKTIMEMAKLRVDLFRAMLDKRAQLEEIFTEEQILAFKGLMEERKDSIREKRVGRFHAGRRF